MENTTKFFPHLIAVHKCLPRFGAEAKIDVTDFRLEIRARNRYYHLIAQFLGLHQGQLLYSPTLPSAEQLIGFVGWLPYFNKRWPLAIDKLLFKEFCTANNLRTPSYWNQHTNSLHNVIIKKRSSSFGNGIRGPFSTSTDAESQSRLANNEYYEQFIPGIVAKAWFWNQKLICLEMRDMPTITGDGVHSFYQLIAKRIKPGSEPPKQSELAALARFQGVSVDDILPTGITFLADFRYNSQMLPLRPDELKNTLPQPPGTNIEQQFFAAGPLLWEGIPEDVRASTLFTVDAIVDRNNHVWFLEMNCNPMVHPDVYLPMFEGLFGPAAEPASLARDAHVLRLPDLKWTLQSTPQIDTKPASISPPIPARA